MPRVVTFGRQPDTPPPGTWRPIVFPQLALLDEGTNEGLLSRILHSDGADTRELPRTVYFQKTQTPGHEGSVAIAALYEVHIDGEAGIASGEGWMADVPEARDAAPFIIAKALHHNSVDLSEVKVRIEEEGDFFSDDFRLIVHFDEWKLGATTLVGKPAFANARAELPDWPDEIKAALEDDSPLVVDAPVAISISLTDSDEEILASATGVPPWAYFHRPEAETPTKIVVGEPDEAGFIPVWGHLARWNTCHDGIEARCITVPRPPDGYASFNKNGVLTDRGQIETGPLCLKGGHTSLAKALDDVANAWADVRVTAGIHGPWLSGVVRPGVPADDVYAARASRISGHWKGGRLKAIVSVSAEGYDVPGTGFSVVDGEVTELVASFVPCADDPTPESVGDAFRRLIAATPAWASTGPGTEWAQALGGQMQITQYISTPPTITEPVADDFDADMWRWRERQRQALEADATS